MLAPSKRRVTLYTLPLVVVIGFLSVVGLAAWQRSDVIADLADQVAHGEKVEATTAVRQLAAIPNPPLSILAEAAASDEHATADTAQVAINRMLGLWQRQVDKKQRVNSVAGQVTELAAALAAQRHAFPPSDYPWLSSATRKIVRVANKCPAKKTPMVALHCDEIMSVVEKANPSAAPIAGRAEPADEAPKKEIASPAAEIDGRESQQVRLEHDFSEFPSQPVMHDVGTNSDASGPSESKPLQPPAANDAGLRSKNVNRSDDGQASMDGLGDLGSNERKLSPDDPTWRPDWSLPMYRILPAAPVTAKVRDTKQSATDAKPPLGRKLDAKQQGVDDSASSAEETRALLERWRDASVSQRFEIEEDLAARGFRRLPARVIKQYLSDNLATRMRVVDSVLTEPGVDARPWLLLLAEDENADVRLSAVTVMATSDDKSLVEAAWQIAIRDRDPRVADLAARLRERRR